MSVVRFYYQYRSFYLVSIIPDRHYSIGFVTAAAETNLAIVTASAPALWPLARKWFPGTFQKMHISQAFQQDPLNEIKDTVSSRSDTSRDSQKPILYQTKMQRHRSFGVYAQRTIGGTEMELGREERQEPFGIAEVYSPRVRRSQEEMFIQAGGIIMRKDVTIHEADLEAQHLPSEPDEIYLCDYHDHMRSEARRSRNSKVGPIEDNMI
jgi:hypothetical protein